MTIRHLVTGLLSATALMTASHFAVAADMPVKGVSRSVYAPPPVMPYNWSGIYVGAHGGWATGSIETTVGGASLDQDGWFLGAQIGYNWQAAYSPWVFGVELDAAWASIEGSETAVAGVATATLTSETQFLGSVRGRVGYAYDRWLPYVTGGLAYSQNEITASATVPGFAVSVSDDQSSIGYTVGAGVEWAFAPRWSAKLEYLYYDLGSATYFENVGGGFEADTSFQTIKIGLNYRFN